MQRYIKAHINIIWPRKPACHSVRIFTGRKHDFHVHIHVPVALCHFFELVALQILTIRGSCKHSHDELYS